MRPDFRPDCDIDVLIEFEPDHTPGLFGIARVERELSALEEYDFSRGVRGKYAKRFAEGSNVVVLSPDVAEVFPDSESVNQALRILIRAARKVPKEAA